MKFMLFLALTIKLAACSSDSNTVASTHKDIKPSYNQIDIALSPDSIDIHLANKINGDREQINLFYNGNSSFLSLYDNGTGIISFYNLSGGQLIKEIPVKNLVKDEKL